MAKRTRNKTDSKNTKRQGTGATGEGSKIRRSAGSPTRKRGKGSSSPKTCRGASKAAHDRITHSLSEDQTKLILNAVQHADRIDLPLNRMITINWSLAEMTDPHAARQHLLSLIYNWKRTRGRASAYVWVMENGPRHGVHCHILMHVHPTLRKDFNRLFRGWRKQVGIPWKRGVVHNRHVGLTSNAAFARGHRVLIRSHLGQEWIVVIQARLNDAVEVTWGQCPHGCLRPPGNAATLVEQSMLDDTAVRMSE